MPFQKGHPGKQKGTTSLKRRTIEEKIESSGLDTILGLCYFALGDWKALGYDSEKETKWTGNGIEYEEYRISPELRLHALKEVTQYQYAKKRHVEVSADPDKGFKIIVEDYSSEAKK